MSASLTSDNYQLKWHSFGAHLHTSVATLFQSDCYTDTILCTHDGRQIKAHRFLLSLCSVYFQNIFKHHIKSISSLPLIVIMPPDIDYKTLKTLIQYIYCGETTVSNDILEHVLKAGDTLKIRGLWRPKDYESSNQTAPQSRHTDVSTAAQQQSTKKQIPPMNKIVIASDKIQMANNLQSGAIETTHVSTAASDNSERIKIENVRTQTENEPNTCDQDSKIGSCSLKIEIKKPESLGIKCTTAQDNSIPELKTRTNLEGTTAADKSKTTLNQQNSSPSKESSEPKRFRTVIKSIHTISSSDNKSDDTTSEKSPTAPDNDENMEEADKYIVIKEEPIEWDQLDDVELSENELFQTEMTIKPEIIFPHDEEEEYQMQIEEEKEENYYSPLTCELCSETFTLPAEWVRHIEGHSDLHQPAKRQRRGRSTTEEGTSKLPPLVCDLCQKLLPTPAEWVRHIQTTHTERELAASNNSNPPKTKQIRAFTGSDTSRFSSAGHLKICNICNKRFPSHASMVIHARTHTGERPFLCTLCNKGFNVKSNLLRHLRTLHDKIISSTEVTDKQESSQ